MIDYLIMACYGKYNSFRIAKIGMQEITELFQFAFRIITHRGNVVMLNRK